MALEASLLLPAMCERDAKIRGSKAEYAARDDLIASVMPLMIEVVKKFWARMRPTEKANYEFEDLVAEVWSELATKHHLYDQGRSKFSTFAVDLARKHLSELRNRMRTVHSPRNSGSRLKKLSIESQSARRIMASMAEPRALSETTENESEGNVGTPDVTREDSKKAAEEAIDIGLADDPVLRLIIKASYGIEPMAKMPASEIADILNINTADVVRMRSIAEQALVTHAESVIAAIQDAHANDDGDFAEILQTYNIV